PSHQYTGVGTYEVSLTVGDLHGEDTATEAHYIIVPFPDTPYAPTPYWSMYYVLACVDGGVVGGYEDGMYHGDWAVNRGQMSVFVSRALAEGEDNVPEPTTDPGFTDVDSEHWAYKYICYAVDQNVVTGYPEGDYRPDQDVTRDQMAVYMARAMVAPTTSVLADYTPADPQDFPDVLSDHWAYKYVEYCVEQGVVGGYPEGDYRPSQVVTRDQMAVYIARAFDLDMATPTYDITDYFPLAEGDTWTCQIEGGGTFTRTVSGTVEKHSRTYVRILDAANSAGDYWSLESEGLYRGGDFDSDEDITFDPPVVFPNGIAVGDSGAAVSTEYVNAALSGAGTFGWELVAVESVTVPAGTFPDCMKVRLTPDFPSDYNDMYIWFARDVGMVKYEGISELENWELLSANVGGAVYP
ncbi:MAG: S-layer homology domain-containing protein, partial [Armatimonadetes bacterium]|nr:S-layer homology domain-containing protein [Armatimonadota bacterium]